MPILHQKLTRGETLRSALDPSEWRQKDLATIKKELRGSISVGSLLFSNGIILGEGETESAALPVWFEKEHGQALERSNVAFHWVGGDASFETYLRVARSFGTPWAVLCDAKVICYPTPGDPKNIARQMNDAGIVNLTDFDQLDFAQRRSVQF